MIGDLDVGGGGAANTRLTTRGSTDDANASAFEAANSSGATMFFIRNDGRVGIGANSPASLLHVAGTFQVGVDDTGHDVKFFGATAGSFLLWDESDDSLKLTDILN